MKRYIKADVILPEDEGFFEQMDLAENPSISPRTLLRLYNSPNDAVRVRVVMNPSAPREILEDAVYGKNRMLKLCVAQNPNLPNYLYDYLVNHSTKEVQKMARDARRRLGL